MATIYNVPSGTVAATLSRQYPGRQTAAAVHADGTRLAVASALGYVEVFAAGGGTRPCSPGVDLQRGGASGLIDSVTFSLDSSEVAFAAGNGTAKIYNLAHQQLVTSISAVRSPAISSVAFSPDGQDLVTAGHDGAIQIWQPATGRQLLPLDGDTGIVNLVQFRTDGKEVLSASTHGTARVREALPRQASVELVEPGDAAVVSGAFSPDGSMVVAASSDGWARVWDRETGRPVTSIPVAAGQSAAASVWDPACRPWVLTSASQVANDATIWDARTGKAVRTLEAPGGSVAVWVWNDRTGRLLETLHQPARTLINTAAFNPAGTEVVTGDGSVRIVSATTGRQLEVLTMRGRAEVQSAVFNPAGTEVLTATADGRVSVWDLATKKRVFSVTLPGGAIVNAATFNPAGTEVLAAFDAGTARLWSLSGGTLLTTGPHAGPAERRGG